MSIPNLNTFAPTSSVAVYGRTIFPVQQAGASIIVIGAGAFGGWAALNLLRKGYRVTLVDAWGAGNSRSSSGDETRVIRSTYGSNETYFDMNVRSIELWKQHEVEFGHKLFHNSGVIWFCYESSTPLVDDSIPYTLKHSMEYEYLTIHDIQTRYPLINTKDLHHGYLDPFGGYLKSREATVEVQRAFIREGGKYVQQHAKPNIFGNAMTKLMLENGGELKADLYLFACGSWMGQLFPGVIGKSITCTKQEVYYFGTPSYASRAYDELPVWVDVDGKDFYYGIPGNAQRGFKIGVDIRGPGFDPTNGDRTSSPETLQKARDFIGHRFPGLKNAPVLEQRVCPYENSPDGNFIFDVHPEAKNVVLLGGGSGHGFKHGPAVGEMVARATSGESSIPAAFQLPRG